MQIARIPLTHSHLLSLSAIALGRFSTRHPLSTQSFCKFLLFCRQWCVHVSESTGKRHFWVCLGFSSSIQHNLFVLLGLFVRWKVCSRTAAFCEILLPGYFHNSTQHFCSFHDFLQAFSMCLGGASINSTYSVSALKNSNSVLQRHQIFIWSIVYQ